MHVRDHNELLLTEFGCISFSIAFDTQELFITSEYGINNKTVFTNNNENILILDERDATHNVVFRND